MKTKSQINAKSEQIVDINDLSKYIKQGIYDNMNKHMGAFTFYFELDNENEIELIKKAHENLLETYSVFVDLYNKVFSVKW